MKTLYKKHWLLGLVFLLTGTLHAQYITLKGKQFYDQNGQPFYPVICNYSVELTCLSTACVDADHGIAAGCAITNFEVHPFAPYGSSGNYEEPFIHGITKIKADLQKIHDMGFNTVRIIFWNFVQVDHHQNIDPNSGKLMEGARAVCKNYNDPWDTYQYEPMGHPLVVKPPYNTNYNLHNIILPKYVQVMDAAAAAGLKVVLVIAGIGNMSGSEGKDYNTNNPSQPTPVTGANLEQAEDYRDYLEVFADMFKIRTEILAYDLYNEPNWNLTHPVNGVELRANTELKNEICNFTAMWYDALKTVDPNHLVTISIGTGSSVLSWDAAVMKLDFVSYHDYPHWHFSPPEYTNMTADALRERIMNRMNAVMHWISRTCPMPWILGETAATAWTEEGQDYIIPDIALGINVNAKYEGQNASNPPWAWGSYEDQRVYATQSQQMVMNHGGSGYAYWAWMDDRAFVNGQINFNDGHKDFVERFEGLLKRGDPQAVPNNTNPTSYVYNNTLDKPLLSPTTGAFLPTSTNAVTHAQPGGGNIPANYDNPYQGTEGTNYTLYGTVQDNNSPQVGIADAVLETWNSIPETDPKYKTHSYNVFTITQADGSFKLIAPIEHTYSNPLDPTHSIDYSKFNGGRYAGPATSWEWLPTADLPELTTGNTYTITTGTGTGQLRPLQRQPDVFNNTNEVKNLTINSGNSPTEYKARNKLLVENVTVTNTGTADFYASAEVEILPGFEAAQGSETEIYIGTVDFNCAKLNSPVAYKTDEEKMLTAGQPYLKNIAVNYQLATSTIKLVPNPASDIVYIITDDKGEAVVEIVSYTGAVVYAQQLMLQPSTPISVSNLVSGSYIVKISTAKQTELFKLTITKN